MNYEEILQEIEALKGQIEQAKLSTRNILKILPHFRLDWGLDQDRILPEYNIGVTKPILLSKLSNSENRLGTDNLLLKNNKLIQLLAEPFFIEKKLSKTLLLEIHANLIPDGGH